MSIAFVNLGVNANPDINSTTNANAYSNSSQTFPTDGLIIAWVGSKNAGGGGTTTPTIGGTDGLTWVQIGSTLDCTGSHGLSLFAADASDAVAGVTTVDFGGVTQHHCSVSFSQVTGVDLSGGVAAAFVQNVNNQTNNVTSLSVTLASAANADNRPIAGIYHDENEGKTPRTNWTELDDLFTASRNHGLETQFRAGAFEITASGSWSTTANAGIIAAELKADTGGPVEGVGSSSGSAIVTGVARSSFASDASSSGVASISGAGLSSFASDGSSTGIASVNGVGLNVFLSVGSSDGIAVASGFSLSLFLSDGQSVGIASVSGIGSAIAFSQGASTGVASVAGIGLATFESVGSSSGLATVSGVGSAGVVSEGSSTGQSTVVGLGAALWFSDGLSSGIAVGTGVGSAFHFSEGSSSGVAVVTGVSQPPADEGVGQSAGVATVNGISGAVKFSVGLSQGSSVVLGKSPIIKKGRRTRAQASRRILPPVEVEPLSRLPVEIPIPTVVEIEHVLIEATGSSESLAICLGRSMIIFGSMGTSHSFSLNFGRGVAIFDDTEAIIRILEAA